MPGLEWRRAPYSRSLQSRNWPAALQTYGGSVDAEIDTIIDEVDKNADGGIDYEEFVAMMMKQSEEAAVVERVVQKRRSGLNSYKALQAFQY